MLFSGNVTDPADGSPSSHVQGANWVLFLYDSMQGGVSLSEVDGYGTLNCKVGDYCDGRGVLGPGKSPSISSNTSSLSVTPDARTFSSI